MRLTYPEAAAKVGVSERTLSRWVAEKKIQSFRMGGRRVVDLAEVVAQANPNTAPPPPETPLPCRIAAVANQKGGVGKTTTCANLAAALSRSCRVLAVDCDPQGNLTQSMGLVPDNCAVTILDVLLHGKPVLETILTPVLDLPNLSLIPANLDLSEAESELIRAIGGQNKLRRALRPLMDRYDFIILDCPPTVGVLTLNALIAATEIIVPIDMGLFSLLGVNKLLKTIEEARLENNELGAVYALSSRTDKTNVSTDVQAGIEMKFGDRLFKTHIRRSVKVAEAQFKRKPITLFDPSNPAAKDYFALAEEVLNVKA